MSWLTRAASRIWLRLLAFNLLLVVLFAAGVLFLDTYEEHLLVAQERTMAQEGRLLAAALEAQRSLDAEYARRILVQLEQRHLARLRVVDSAGELLVDSARLGPRREDAGDETGPAPPEPLLYRIGSWPVRVVRALLGHSAPPSSDAYESVDRRLGPEIRDALDGRYGTAMRASGSSLVMHVAIPVRSGDGVVGAVVVSQSTRRILAALDAVRLDVFRLLLTGVAAAVLLSLVVATTIVRPLASLRRRAEAIVDRRGRLRGSFAPTRRHDEIGDLERALAVLTRRLEDHLASADSFAADLAHECKNPLASIRSATEMAREVDDPTQRARFFRIIEVEVARMERLLSEAREMSRIDAAIEEEERTAVDLGTLVAAVVEGFRLRLADGGPRVVLAVADHDLVVDASQDRLAQALTNLLDNAISFSPPSGRIGISLDRRDHVARVAITDQGPGVPPEHRERIFSRFFSFRPPGSGDSHIGLGLAVVKTIVEGYGGAVSVADGPDGGARFVVTLPTRGNNPPSGDLRA